MRHSKETWSEMRRRGDQITPMQLVRQLNTGTLNITDGSVRVVTVDLRTGTIVDRKNGVWEVEFADGDYEKYEDDELTVL